MNKNLYNIEDEKLKNVVDILKQLPQINTPANFEYNLMTKIRNRQFDTHEEKNKSKFFGWILAPAALVISTVVLFFVFSNQNIKNENPLMSEPSLRLDASSNNSDTIEIEKYTEETSSVSSNVAESKDSKSDNQPVSPPKTEKYRIVLNPNDVVLKEKVAEPPYDDKKAVDIDNYIEGAAERKAAPTGATLVGENEQYFDFNGFFVRQKKDSTAVDTLKAKMDSIKNALKSDKTKKLPGK
ncbi:MAG: hypothetical protein V1720_21290 [bacterium]